MSENIDWGAIDDFVAETEKDDRYGEHDAMVTGVTQGLWPDGVPNAGKPYFQVDAKLMTTRNQASVNFRLSEPMSREELNIARNSPNARAISLGQRLIAELYKFYAVSSPLQLKAGDMLRVKMGPQTSKKTGLTFPRVLAFKPKEQIGQASKDAAAAADQIPF